MNRETLALGLAAQDASIKAERRAIEVAQATSGRRWVRAQACVERAGAVAARFTQFVLAIAPEEAHPDYVGDDAQHAELIDLSINLGGALTSAELGPGITTVHVFGSGQAGGECGPTRYSDLPNAHPAYFLHSRFYPDASPFSPYGVLLEVYDPAEPSRYFYHRGNFTDNEIDVAAAENEVRAMEARADQTLAYLIGVVFDEGLNPDFAPRMRVQFGTPDAAIQALAPTDASP